MRRHLSIAGLAALLLVCASIVAAHAETPAEAAARQEAEENYRRMNARVDDLFAAVESLQKRFSAMQDEIRKLNEEVGRATDRTRDAGAQDTLKQLAKAIEEVDKKRREDRDKMLGAFADLEKGIASLGSARPSPTQPKAVKPKAQSPKNGGAAPAPPAQTEKGYDYVIQENDTLTRIVTALNKQGLKLTGKQVVDANPTVNWNKLQIGQKIFIPSP